MHIITKFILIISVLLNLQLKSQSNCDQYLNNFAL